MSKLVIGGNDAKEFENPFQVALLTRTTEDTFRAQFCGGSFTSLNHVAITAHFVEDLSPYQVEVLAGTRKLDDSGTRFRVVNVTCHLKYKSNKLHSHVAVL